LLAKTKRPIKIALMDQALIAGIGNIYAAEALWRAEIHPDTPAQAIDKKGSARLARAILKSLKSSLDDLERDGDDRFRVYGREGEACFRCKKAQIVRTEHQGRSTFHCPSCQARPRRR
jgi:formamidopyrimidine-DNA glycosylase